MNLPLSMHQYVFRLQNMHFNFRGDFTWNVAKFEPELRKIMEEAYELGRAQGRQEMAEHAGKVLTNQLMGLR